MRGHFLIPPHPQQRGKSDVLLREGGRSLFRKRAGYHIIAKLGEGKGGGGSKISILAITYSIDDTNLKSLRWGGQLFMALNNVREGEGVRP